MHSADMQIKEKSLVLVLGAGASSEVNLPIGAELTKHIADKLRYRYEAGRRLKGGDETIYAAFHEEGQSLSGKSSSQELAKAASLICEAMPIAMSIDNFIDSHRSDRAVAFCGKLAITRCILEAESKSSLAVDRSNIHNRLNLNSVQGTWFKAFFQLLTENCQRSDLYKRFQEVAVISFNYDRCFEQFMFWALQSFYNMSAKDAAELLELLLVHHPYGKVGNLPWMSGIDSIDFGAVPNAHHLISISQQLRTFTEGTDPDLSHVQAIRSTIASAKRLVFLGFAFHRLNLDLLYGGNEFKSGGGIVFATAAGISNSDVDFIKESLVKYAAYQEKNLRFRDLKCAGLFGEYWRSLALS